MLNDTDFENKLAHCDDASYFLNYVKRTFLKYRDFVNLATPCIYDMSI